jgi:hypothetical protein
VPGSWRSLGRRAIDGVDHAAAFLSGKRRVLMYVRSAMHAAVLGPIARALQRDRRIDLRYIAEHADKQDSISRAYDRPMRWIGQARAAWSRVDLLVGSDPWSLPTLRRCRRRINFFHGVGGKYDLDDPGHLPIGFDLYDRVAFVNADRMQRYLSRGIVRPDAAVLIGFPKLDELINSKYDASAVRRRLGLEGGRPTAIYAPTWSPCSSLNLAGEAIVGNLAAAGWNVIVKPHAWSFDPDPKYSGGVDWRERIRAIEKPGQVVLCEEADASPLLASADLMVTDHSSIGFEFCLLDRPLIVFDAPDLARAARINPERIATLRSAARVVAAASEIGRAANEELADPARLRSERAAAARPLFHDPGTATERAVAVVYELLELPAPMGVVHDATAGRAHPVGATP